MAFSLRRIMDKQAQIVLFSSTAIALYGYDQGMMSLINTNYNYLATMGIARDDPLVGVIVSVYYLGCAVGAVLASWFADVKGRKPGIFACLAAASLGNLIMFVAGLGGTKGHALATMLLGRIVMGLGVGGIDSVVPVYSSELSRDDARGTSLAKEFQANIFGLNMAFIVNVCLTRSLGKTSEWAWRLPIIIMQVYPLLLFSGATLLPETPRWLLMHGDEATARRSMKRVFGSDDDVSVSSRMDALKEAQAQEERDGRVSYAHLLHPGGQQFHPTAIVVMGQVNQALTGYGAVSVYGPQIFALLGFGVATAELLTLGNYLFYLAAMTLAWALIDRIGRRALLVHGSAWLALSFALLALLAGLGYHHRHALLATAIPGILVLYLATAVFGICWLVPPWLIPTEIYPSPARARGAAISVIIWGLANFAVTLLTPIGFNGLQYFLFLVFAGTNAVAGLTSYLFCPESGKRSFEENIEFFDAAGEQGSWVVSRVRAGEYMRLPDKQAEDADGGDSSVGGGGRGGDEEEPHTRRKTDGTESTPLLAGSR